MQIPALAATPCGPGEPGPLIPGLSSLPCSRAAWRGPRDCVPCVCSRATWGPALRRQIRIISSCFCALFSSKTVPLHHLSLLTSNELKLLRDGKSPPLSCCFSSCPLRPLPWALPPWWGKLHCPRELMASPAWHDISQFPLPPPTQPCTSALEHSDPCSSVEGSWETFRLSSVEET